MTPLPQQPPCECPGPGFCSRYQIRQTEFAWRLCACQGTEARPISEAKSARMRQLWADRRDGKQRTPRHKATATAKPVARTSIQKGSRAKKRGGCVHLQEPTGEIKECLSCSRMLRKHRVYACDKHGTCTIGKGFDGIACCKECGDYQEVRS